MWTDKFQPKWGSVAFRQMANGGLPIYNSVMMDFASEARCTHVRTEAAALGA